MTYVIDRAGIVRAALLPQKTPYTEQDISGAISPIMGTGGK
jgi:hypothetical protein